MNADGYATEIPTSLKRLVRLVMRGFYSCEYAIVMDMLIRNPCMKEDDLADLLKFEKKQLRAITAQLKQDRFIKTRLRMETGADGKATRQNYYYIDYKLFVNVVKYKLDHMRRKIETEERDSTSRASFKCTNCQKTFTDLEAGELCDFMTGEFRCSFCSALVEEDESGLPKANSRLMLARFNEQIEPLYNLLREVDDVKLAPELLEPEPTDLSFVKKDASGQKNRTNPPAADTLTWSGEATRHKSFPVDQNITINIGDDNSMDSTNILPKKEQPSWMKNSTIKGVYDVQESHKKVNIPSILSNTDNYGISNNSQDNIMEALLAHERKSGEPAPYIPGQANNNEDSSSESEDSLKVPQNFQNILVDQRTEEFESEEETLTILIGNEKVPLTEITEKHVAKMTPTEKEAYIRVTQDLYSSYYD